ncbi:MAG: hypothetical protein U9N77_04320 [Thermodesulfobacteriota bacterium]|nr:hypothetical protein [Thermodesulfobacteriota bacterium]
MAIASVHICMGLFKSEINGLFKTFIKDFKLKNNFLNILLTFFSHNEQICTHPAKAVFTFYSSAGVYYPLKKCLEQKLGAGLFIIETLNPIFGMFPEKFLTGFKIQV